MQLYTTTGGAALVRLDGEETHQWKTEDADFRNRIKEIAYKHAEKKRKKIAIIEAENEIDGVLWRDEI